MNKLRLVVLAVVILCSLWYIGIVIAHITSMWIYAESDWDDGVTHYNGATWISVDLGAFPRSYLEMKSM